MFAQRWSTFTVLCLLALAMVLGFCGGKYYFSTPVSSTSSAGPDAGKTIVSIGSQGSLEPKLEMFPETPAPKPENAGDHCRRLLTRPATPDRDDELLAAIEKMAEQDPLRALALATAQTNLRLQAALLRAALKGWGTTDPEAAVKWTQSQTVMDPSQAINALLQGAIHDPDQAVSLTTALIQNDSSRASEFGTELISALTGSGQFERAANFAASSPANYREDLMLPAYSRWAEFQPQAAIASAMQITDAGLRDTALNAVIAGWSPTDPKGLMEYAQNNLPAGQQNSALSSAIVFWADSDPVAAANWINQNNPGPQTDNGVAEIALSPQLAQKPELAATWAEKISNPQLRLETLATLIGKWTAVDQAGAENYIKNSPVLTPDDRGRLLEQSRMLAELKK